MRRDPLCFATSLAAFTIILGALATGDALAAEQATQAIPFHDKPVFNREPLVANRFANWNYGLDPQGKDLAETIEFKIASPVPQSPVSSSEPLEEITLKPYGSVRLRVSHIPVIGPAEEDSPE